MHCSSDQHDPGDCGAHSTDDHTALNIELKRVRRELELLMHRQDDLQQQINRLHAALQASAQTHGPVDDDKKFRHFFEQSSDGIVLVNDQGIVIDWNRGAETLFGLTWAEVLDRPLWDVQFQVTPEEYRLPQVYARLKAAILELMQSGSMPEFGPQTIEGQTIQRPDGTRRIIHSEVFPIETARGQLFGGIVRDITERRQAEETLRESEQLYRDLYTTVQRQAQELHLLSQVRTVLSRDLELTDLLRAVVDAIVQSFGYTHVSIFLLHDDTLRLCCHIGYEAPHQQLPLSQGIMGRSIRLRQPLLVKDTSSDLDFVAGTSNITSEISVPLCEHDQVIGILNVESVNGVELTETDLQLIVALGEHISAAVARARLYQEVRDSEKRFRDLFESSPDAVLVSDYHGFVLDVNPAACLLHTMTREQLIGNHITDLVPRTNRERTWRDFLRLTRQELLYFEGQSQTLNGHAVPVEIKGNPIVHRGKQALLLHVRDITERKAYHQEIERLAFTDPLTGLANRRHLYAVGDASIQFSQRNGPDLALIYLDLNQFKAVNDTMGHDAGDELLAQVAVRLRECVRKDDTLARIGGDEFAILLPDSGAAEAHDIAQRILSRLKEPFVLQARDIHLGGSIGITIATATNTTFGSLITQADTAMYQAKAAGGGICLYTPELATIR